MREDDPGSCAISVDGSGRVCCVFVAAIETAEGALAERSLSEQPRRGDETVAEIDRANKLFVSQLAHDMRARLALILGPADDLLGGVRGPLTAGQRKQAELVLRSGLLLLDLVDTRLDASRIEGGRLQPAARVEAWRQSNSGAEEPGVIDEAACAPQRGAARILLADDSADMRAYLVSLLSPRWTVEAVPDGEAALASARAWPPDLVLADVLMPKMDGLGLVRALREDPRTRSVPVILLSARAAEEARVAGLEAGADDYLIKPFSARELCARVGSHLELLRLRAEVADERERAHQQLALLAAAGERLAGSLDWETTLVTILEVTLPRLGDFGFLDVIDLDAEVRRTLRVHGDAETEARLAALRWERPHAPDLDPLWTGRPVLRPDIDDAWLRAGARSPAQLEGLRRLGMCSMLAVPLTIQGRTFGVLTLFHGRSGRRHTELDLSFAGELAHRAALALENARLYAASLQATQKADEASRLKDEFLSVLSHELRTPLTAILGWTRILGSAARERDVAARGVEVINRNTGVLIRLIDDILDVSRIVTGKVHLDARPLDLEPLVGAVVEALQLGAEARRLTLTFTGAAALAPGGAPRGPLIVLGDAERLQQVVWNLVSNSIKFTPAGGRIEVRLTGEAAGVCLEVSDTGAGLAADFLPFVFDRFRQADSSSTRAHGGLGLGLAIVRSMVELHDGTVRAESAGVGRGATFRVTLPVLRGVSAVEPAGHADLHPAPALVRLDGLKVLVVDDEHDTRELVATVLGHHGAQVTVASSVREALELLRDVAPDVLISDLSMPGEDGISLLRKVRALDGPERDIPAVALTACARAEDTERSLRAGFQRHVAKPIEPAMLTAVVASLAGGG